MSTKIEWHIFDQNTPRDRRLLLITQPTGTFDIQEQDIFDVVVGYWNGFRGGFVTANEPNDRSTGATLSVRYWANLPDLPSVQLRRLDGLRP
jgi:hypothetical protein